MQKVVLITGASKGIGRKIAEILAINNYTIIANYNNSEKEAIELKRKIEEQGKTLDIYKADITDQKQCKNLVEYVIKEYKKIDVLINNAGIDKIQLITEVTKEDWDNIINTNLYSAFIMCQETVHNMIQNKKGCIINISSIWGQVGASMEVVYSISKAGMDGLTKSLAKELGPSGIRVNSIAPGFIDTDMNNIYNKEEITQIKEEIPLQKIGETIDIAKCVKWLIEDEYTTGQVISINGGWVIT